MKKHIILLATVTLLSNCASYKPDSRGVGQRDYNGRIRVSSPHYKVKPSLASYTGMLAFAAAGGYAAYQYGNGIVTYYDKGERKNIKEADAAIGALTSFSIAYLTNKLLFKTNTTKGVDDYKKWMKKAKLTKDYSFLRGYSDTDLMVIDKSYERNYTVRNYADVLDFEKAFPNSIQTDRVLKDAIKVVKRNELGTLIYKYPNSAYIKDMKYHYIDTSPSLKELLSFRKRYDYIKFDYVKKGKRLINNYIDYLLYSKEYPDELISTKKVTQIVLGNLWDKSYAISSNQTEFFKNFSNKIREISNVKFEKPELKTFIRKMFLREVRKKIDVKLTKVTSSEVSEDVKHYRANNSFFFKDAMFISDGSTKKFLVELNAKNNSIFDLPVKVGFVSWLYERADSKQLVTKALLVIDRAMRGDRRVGSVSETFKLENFKAGQKTNFLMFLDSFKRESSISVGFTVDIDYYLDENYKINLEYDETPMSESEKHKQANWLAHGRDMLVNNSSAVTVNGLAELFIGKVDKYDKRYWENKRKQDRIELAESMRRAREQASQNIDNNLDENLNNTNNNNKTYSNKSPNKCDKGKIDTGMSIPSYKEKDINVKKLSWSIYADKAKEIKFSDGKYGKIFLDYDKNKSWYISTGMTFYYYNSERDAIYALYFLKKCDVITKRNRD